MASFRIKNWEEFQHYRDRRPVWIKLYTDLLNDADFAALSREARGLLLQVELLAAKDGGSLLYNQQVMSFGLRLNDFQLSELNPLFLVGFLIPDEECKHLLEEASLCLPSSLLFSSSSSKTRRKKKVEPEDVRDNPPSAEEVQTHLDELGETRFSGEYFVAANERDGWLTGKGKNRKPIVSWKGTVRTWRCQRDQWDKDRPVSEANDRDRAIAEGRL